MTSRIPDYDVIVTPGQHAQHKDAAHRERDEIWIRACREIIDRCVSPAMYGDAMAMLERAAAEARKIP